MTFILDQTDFQSVRRAIDVTLDDGVTVDADRILPDTVLADPIYIGVVSREILGWLSQPDWPGTLTSNQQVLVKQGAIFLLAARVYPQIPIISQEAFGEHRYRREYESVDDVVNRLVASGIEIIQPILDGLNVPAFQHSPRFRRAGACPRW